MRNDSVLNLSTESTKDIDITATMYRYTVREKLEKIHNVLSHAGFSLRTEAFHGQNQNKHQHKRPTKYPQQQRVLSMLSEWADADNKCALA